MTFKSTRDKGKEFELFILSKIKEIDNTARLSRNSGASLDISDIVSKDYYIECKNWDKSNIIMRISDWNKLVSQMPISSSKIPIYCFQNKDSKRFAILEVEDLIQILLVSKWKEQ